MKMRRPRFVFLLCEATALLSVLLLWPPDKIMSQNPPEPVAQMLLPAQTSSTGTEQAGQEQPPKASAPPDELYQRLEALKRDLQEMEKKVEELSKFVAQGRSHLPSEGVLLDQYLFLQSQVQELSTKIEQRQPQDRGAAQTAKTGAASSQPERRNASSLLSALVLPLFIVLLYDRLFNARRFIPLEARIDHLEDYAYGKEIEQGPPQGVTEKKEE